LLRIEEELGTAARYPGFATFAGSRIGEGAAKRASKTASKK
jgi:hypothetical protein